jgi:hypothetical protein
MVIFHSYVKLPDGKATHPMPGTGAGSPGLCRQPRAAGRSAAASVRGATLCSGGSVFWTSLVNYVLKGCWTIINHPLKLEVNDVDTDFCLAKWEWIDRTMGFFGFIQDKQAIRNASCDNLMPRFNVSSIPESVTQQLPFLSWSNKDRTW